MFEPLSPYLELDNALRIIFDGTDSISTWIHSSYARMNCTAGIVCLHAIERRDGLSTVGRTVKRHGV
jgi:hypothetical protein